MFNPLRHVHTKLRAHQSHKELLRDILGGDDLNSHSVKLAFALKVAYMARVDLIECE